MGTKNKARNKRPENFQNKRNPDELLKIRTCQPNKDWQSPHFKGPILSYTLVSELDPSVAMQANRFWGDTSTLTFENGYSTKIEIKHCDAVKRLDSLNKGIFGQEFCYILDPEQGTLFLDKKDKLYLHLGKEQSLGFQFKGTKWQIDKKEQIILDGRDITKVEINIASPVKCKYVLYFYKDIDLDTFSKEVFKTVITCSDELSRQGMECNDLIKLGIPVKGEFYFTRDCKDELVSSFELKSIRIEDYDASLFSIPKHFSDIRDLKKKYSRKKKGFKYDKPVRYSSIRKKVYRYDIGMNQKIQQLSDFSNASLLASMATHDEGNLKFPECFPSTYGSQVANLVDQKVLDDAKYVVNAISRRLDSFSGSGGNIDIDWLNQFEANANSLGTGPGSGLFYLLRDSTLNGEGLLDRLAEVEAKKLLLNGDVSILTLPASLLARINTVIANAAISPENRFEALNDTEQNNLREAYLEQRLAHINLDYPSSTPAITIFYDLLRVKLYDIEFDLDINNKSVIDTLTFDNDFIHLLIKLPEAKGSAFMSRWPSALYSAIAGASIIACFIFPLACILAAAVVSVGVFLLLDFAFVSIELSNIEVDAQIRFTPNDDNILQPDVTLALDADIDVFYGSVVPTGVHQIISIIVDLVGSHTNIVMNQIESKLQDKLKKFLSQDLSISYPPSFGPVPISGISNAIEFSVNDRMFIQSGLNAGLMGIVNPYITQVDYEIKDHLLQIRDEFKTQFRDPVDRFNDPDIDGMLLNWKDVDFSNVARYYFGSVISQNFINHYIHTLWRNQFFTYELTEQERRNILERLKEAFPQLGKLPIEKMEAHLWPAVSPRTILTPKLSSLDGPYATTFFDDVRLCLGLVEDTGVKIGHIEFSFAAQLYTELGFGGVNTGIGKLDFIKVTDRVFDLYFDLNEIGVEIIHPEIQFFSEPGMSISSSFDYLPLENSEVQDAFRLAIQFALATRTTNLIPRMITDPKTIHRYNIGTKAFQLITQLVPFKQNLYINTGTSGVGTALYDGALDIDEIDLTIAALIRFYIPS